MPVHEAAASSRLLLQSKMTGKGEQLVGYLMLCKSTTYHLYTLTFVQIEQITFAC